MQKTVQKKTCKIMSCKNHAKTMSKSCQNHVMQNMQKPCKKPCKNHANMQKPCNMRRVRWRLHCEKTCKLFVSCKKQAVPHAMKKPRAKPCEKTCKLFVSCKKQAVPHVMQKPCKNHANMQKPCNMRRVRWRTQAGAARRLLCQASGAQFCCNIAATRVSHGAILNQIVGGSSMQGIPAFPVSLSVEGFSKWLIFYLRGF